MIKKIYILSNTILLIFILSFMLVGCSNKKENQLEFNNSVFTKEMYENIVEIDYWNGGDEIIVSNKADIQDIYNSLASLKLTKASPEDALTYGYLIIDLVMNDKTVSFGLASDGVYINNISYYTNINIVDSIRDIALQNEK